MHMVQNVLLVWLDVNIDENSSDCKNAITHLRRIVNTINTFTDDQECFQFLKDVANEKVCMIISGSFGQQMMSHVHDLPQIASIFIFHDDKDSHEEWAKNWSKIKGVFIEVGSICEALNEVVQQCEQNAISMSIMGGDEIGAEKSGNRLDPSFMYTQIMKEILLTINFEQSHVDQFLQYCREALDNNEKQLKYVDKIALEYHQRRPIWWYTCECFLYPMLNRALRTMDVDLMIKLGFFIVDLHRHIEELHQEQFGDDSAKQRFTVYRGQGMDRNTFEKMAANKGGLISFNCFLSTSKDHSISYAFAESALADIQLVGVLFVMNIDPARSSTPFASVTDVSNFGREEDEVLFSMHTVFRIEEISSIGGNPRLVQIQLHLATDTDNDLRQLIDYIRKETFPDEEGWYRLGLVLRKIGVFPKAQQVFEIALRQEINESDQAPIYRQLGLIRSAQGEYTEAIAYYEKSIEIEEKQIPCRELNFAHCYNNIGAVYNSIGDYPKSLSSYEKALVIRQQALPSTHPDLAMSYSNIGLLYYNMGDYPKAFSSHGKALTIREQSLPSTHPDLAMSHGNIGAAYYNIGDYPKSLLSYEKALEIRQQSLPPTHPDLATSQNNIGNVYFSMGYYPKSLSYYEKALGIREKSFPSTHPDLATSHNNIGNVYFSMGDYPKALSSYEKALAIKQHSLPSTHPDLAMSYNNIGEVYYKMDDYGKALSFHEKTLAILQQSLPPVHADLGHPYSNIGLVYCSMGDYPKALSFHEQALAIREQSLPATHPQMADTYDNLGVLHRYIGDYSKALSFHEKALTIRQQSLPSTHPDLASTYDNMGLVHKNMGNYSAAHSYLERAVDMGQRSLPESHPDLEKWSRHLTDNHSALVKAILE